MYIGTGKQVQHGPGKAAGEREATDFPLTIEFQSEFWEFSHVRGRALELSFPENRVETGHRVRGREQWEEREGLAWPLSPGFVTLEDICL